MKKNIGSTFFLKFVKLIVSRILRRYSKISRRRILYNRNRRKKIALKIKKLECYEGLKNDGIFVVATQNGLYLLKNKNLYFLMNGEYYGITMYQNSLIIYEKLTNSGRLLKIKIGEDYTLEDRVEILLERVPHGCHQIDVLDHFLFITDTYNNGILKYNLEDGSLDEYYPLGKLEEGRSSSNYGHINSIYFYKGYAYLLAHNETLKTQRKSEIIVTDMDFEKVRIISTKSSNAHNVFVTNDDILHCDSIGCSLNKNNISVFKTDVLTRGLSISDNLIVLGGSGFTKRNLRPFAKGKLFFLNRNYELLNSVLFPASVTEIRRIDKTDYSLSDQADSTPEVNKNT
jgi:hypothetical protein